MANEEKKQSKEQILKDLKRQERQRTRNTKIKGVKVKEDAKQLLTPGKAYMVGAALADVLVKAGRAEIV